MYLIIAYHGKGKTEVDDDLKKLWFNFSKFVKSVTIKHTYFFQRARDDKGADLLMIIEYKCAKNCLDTSICSCMMEYPSKPSHQKIGASIIGCISGIPYAPLKRRPKMITMRMRTEKKRDCLFCRRSEIIYCTSFKNPISTM